MLARISDSPRTTLPRQPARVQPAMIYVYEKQAWEYRIEVRNATAEEMPSEREMNALGENAWELVMRVHGANTSTQS